MPQLEEKGKVVLHGGRIVVADGKIVLSPCNKVKPKPQQGFYFVVKIGGFELSKFNWRYPDSVRFSAVSGVAAKRLVNGSTTMLLSYEGLNGYSVTQTNERASNGLDWTEGFSVNATFAEEWVESNGGGYRQKIRDASMYPEGTELALSVELLWFSIEGDGTVKYLRTGADSPGWSYSGPNPAVEVIAAH